MALDKILNLIFRIKGAKKAEQDVSKVDNKLVALGKTAIKIGGALFAAKGIISGFQAIGQQAQNAQTIADLERAMLNLGREAGFTTDSLDKFKEATDGTVSSADLLRNANTALVLGVAQSDDQMAQLFDTAQRLGEALGQDTQFAVESLTTGLGRQSKLILDNLGITLDTTVAQQKYAEEINKTVKQLTEEEKRTAFVTEAMRKAKEAVDLLGEEQPTLTRANQELKVAFEDLGLAIGESTLPAVNFFTRAITGAVRGVTNLVNATKINNSEILDNIDAYQGLNPQIDHAIKLYKESVESSGPMTGATRAHANQLTRLVTTYQDEQKVLKAKKIEEENIRLQMEENARILQEVENHTLGLFFAREGEVKQMKKLDLANHLSTESTKRFSDSQELALMGVERFGSAIATAAIHGQNMGQAITASLKSIAAELVSKAATFAMLNLFTGGSLMAAKGGAGFGGFLLRGFTGQTPSVNVNIKGGLVSQSYVKNTLVPALNNARAIG